MREIIVEPVYGLIIAIIVLWLGDLLTRKFSLLSKHNIPAPVTGGILEGVTGTFCKPAVAAMGDKEWKQFLAEHALDYCQKLGLDAFVPVPGQAVIDDHEPFLRAGIPAVDLIDFDFPQWHTTADTPEVCAAASLDQVGRLLLSLIYEP